jgi:hypothetical protein
MHRRFVAAGALTLLLAATASADDVTGSWTLNGRDRTGTYRGTATLTQDASGRVTGALTYDYVSWSWTTFGYAPTGKHGSARLEGTVSGTTLTGFRVKTTGVAGVLNDVAAQRFAITYQLKAKAAGGGLESVGGTYDASRGRDTLTGQSAGGSTTPTGQGGITMPSKILVVPGTPEAGRAQVSVQVTGSAASLALSGPGRLLRDGTAVTSPLSLPVGTHRLQVEGTADGRVTLTLSRGTTTVGTASADAAVERLYMLLEGYQGAEVDYLEGDLGQIIAHIVPKLPGYARIEDGKGYDQSKIDAGLADPTNPRRVLIDWNTTREDLFRYLRRGTVRGFVWGSHGFMEPWPTCPDNQLDMFESRVWSATAGDPSSGDAKNFMRELKDLVAASARQHGKLDFVMMHACCTGGIGSYAPEVWEYITPATKDRCLAKLGDPLPDAAHLRYSTFQENFAPSVSFLKTFFGPSYFGLSDVPWSSITGSIQPTR